MTIKLTEEKYKKLKKDVAKNRQLISLDGLNAKEKEKQVMDHADSLIFDNDEEKQIYIANFLIPDDKQFYEFYLENGKNLNKCAEKLGVSSSIVLARIFELGKYQEYMSKIVNGKGESIMGEIEIIDAYSETENVKDKHVDDNTVEAISRINQLFELNSHQEGVISKQSKTIENQSKEINILEVSVKNKDTIITGLKGKSEEKDSKISEIEKELKNCRMMINELIPYRDNYNKIVSFLNKCTTNDENHSKML